MLQRLCNEIFPFLLDEESTDESLGLKDVIHSVGALLSIVQTFPTLGDSFENKYLDHHSHKNTNQNTNTHSHEIPMGHESKVQTKFEVTSTNTNSKELIPFVFSS